MAIRVCVRCNEEGEDRRFLRVSCGYDLSEASDKLELDPYLNIWVCWICKGCRGDFIGLLREFLNKLPEPPLENSEANIPVRVDGCTVMMTYPQWLAYKAEHKNN